MLANSPGKFYIMDVTNRGEAPKDTTMKLNETEELKKARLDIIRGLHTLLKYANDEEIQYADLEVGIPDGDTADDWADEIRDNDYESFEDFLRLYLPLCNKAYRHGGFYGLTENVIEKETTNA